MCAAECLNRIKENSTSAYFNICARWCVRMFDSDLIMSCISIHFFLSVCTHLFPL